MIALVALLGATALAQDPEPTGAGDDPAALHDRIEHLSGELERLQTRLAEQEAAIEAQKAMLQAERDLADEAAREATSAQQAELQHLHQRRRGRTARASNTSHVAEGETVGPLVVFGEDVEIAGRVQGHAVAIGGDILVRETGAVEGDAVAIGGDINVEPGGSIDGDRVGIGGEESVDVLEEPAASGAIGSFSSLIATITRRLTLFFSLAGAGVLLVGLAPDRVGRVARGIETHPLRSLLVGATSAPLLMLAAILFAITLIGLPASLVVLVILGASWLLGFVALCQAIGDQLPMERPEHGRWLAFLIGTALLTLFGSLPFLGWLVILAASVVAIGGAFSARFGSP